MTPVQKMRIQALATMPRVRQPVPNDGGIDIFQDWSVPEAVQALAEVVLELAVETPSKENPHD